MANSRSSCFTHIFYLVPILIWVLKRIPQQDASTDKVLPGKLFNPSISVTHQLLQLFGGAILGVSIWLQNDSDSLMQLFDGMPKDSGAVKGYFRMLGGIGFAIGITCLSNSWMGFTGACARHKILLYVVSWWCGHLSLMKCGCVCLCAWFQVMKASEPERRLWLHL